MISDQRSEASMYKAVSERVTFQSQVKLKKWQFSCYSYSQVPEDLGLQSNRNVSPNWVKKPESI